MHHIFLAGTTRWDIRGWPLGSDCSAIADQITRAINDKIAADQEAQKMLFVLQKEKQEAERKHIEAEGQAKAQQIVSASLTPQIIEYQRIQALRAIGDKGNMIITPMDGATPMIQVQGKR
jgi:prohibitin 1